jgi:hypothetical protein
MLAQQDCLLAIEKAIVRKENKNKAAWFCSAVVLICKWLLKFDLVFQLFRKHFHPAKNFVAASDSKLRSESPQSE